jgi:hypothetical protein
VANEHSRVSQIILIGTLIGFSWLAMQAVHELGHVMGARATGADIKQVVLHPMTISRTDLGQNPKPLQVVWAGPLVGALLPLAAYLLCVGLRMPFLYLLRFFVGFCLVANGVYIGSGAFIPLADTAVMAFNGSPRWLMALYGLIAIPLGFILWNKQGKHFGLGNARGQVDFHATLITTGLFVIVIALELILS